jgi:diaminopimelate decarboxylase
MKRNEILRWLRENGDDLPTPLYLYDVAQLDASIELLKGLVPPEARLFYSLKANPQPAILRHFHKHGLGAEAVSDGELKVCARAGVSPHNVIFGGVAKTQEQLRRAVAAGYTCIVIDSQQEWEHLLEAVPSGAAVNVLLRINPGQALGGLDMGSKCQFGMSLSQGLDLAGSANELLSVNFLGLHAYLGSQRLTCKPVVETVKLITKAVEAFKSEGLAPRVVNIGLGCGVPYLERDSELPYDDLRDQLREAWMQPAWNDVEIWSEAGRYLVARAGYFIARVVDRKTLYDKQFVFLDGGLNVHNPGLGLGRVFRSNPRFLFPNADSDAEREAIDLVGNLCTSADCIGHDAMAPILVPGDLVAIPNAGAYCQTTAMWGFNSQGMFREWLLHPGAIARPIEPQHSFLSEAPET